MICYTYHTFPIMVLLLIFWSIKQLVLQITNQGYFLVPSSLINFFSSLKLEQTVVSSIGNQWNVNHGLIDILFSITVPPCLSIDWLPNTIFVIIKGEILLNWQQSHNCLFMYAHKSTIQKIMLLAKNVLFQLFDLS